MPEPRKSESMKHFVGRFMGASHAQKFPQKQRAAIAYSEYRAAKKRK